MKIREWIALLLIMAFGFTGCATQVEFDKQALSARSETYTQNLIEGNYTGIAEDVSFSASSQLNADVIKRGWEGISPSLGAFESMGAISFTAGGSAALVETICHFENRDLLLKYTYNAKSELSGMWMAYIPQKAQAESTAAYTERVVPVGRKDAPLEGILTLPASAENPPAVLLIAGSGQQDMDETVGAAGNKPLADLAHGLAQRGVASLRYNKRTAQYPGEPVNPQDLTIRYEVLDDAASAAGLLKNTDVIDSQHIYVLGHSLGGMLAPKIAQENSLSGLISLAGSPRSLEDIVLDQNKAALGAVQGISDQEKQPALAQAEAQVDAAKNAKEGGIETILNAPENYWYTLHGIDTPVIAQSLDIPMLFLQGGADFQISPEKDFNAWKTLLSGNPNAEFKLYPSLNHLFMPAAVDPDVIEDIASWILRQE